MTEIMQTRYTVEAVARAVIAEQEVMVVMAAVILLIPVQMEQEVAEEEVAQARILSALSLVAASGYRVWALTVRAGR